MQFFICMYIFLYKANAFCIVFIDIFGPSIRMQLTFSFDLTFLCVVWYCYYHSSSCAQSPDRRGKGVITVSIKKKVNCLNRRIASSVLCVACQNGRNAQFGSKCLFFLTLPQQKQTSLHSQLHIEICEKHIKREENIQRFEWKLKRMV